MIDIVSKRQPSIYETTASRFATFVSESDRWYKLRQDLESSPKQKQYWFAITGRMPGVRFVLNHAGRRWGKSELPKRAGVRNAALFTRAPDGRFDFAAPTRDWAKDLFWDDLKAMVPDTIVKRISEADLRVTLINGVTFRIIGLDRPSRAEGKAIDWAWLDEYAYMKDTAWSQTYRGSLSTLGRPGVAIFTGKPAGRNHWYKLVMLAKSKKGAEEGYKVFSGHARETIGAEEAESAMIGIDDQSYAQEYGGQFVAFSGRAVREYDVSDDYLNCTEASYDPSYPLHFRLDFNVEPGVAVVVQEQPRHKVFSGLPEDWDDWVSVVVGEVYIQSNSCTELVCQKLVEDWQRHKHRPVIVHGDASGVGRASQSRAEDAGASNWDIVEEVLGAFFTDIEFRIPAQNPSVVNRINALNSRCKDATGVRRFFVNQEAAPNTHEDLSGTVWKRGAEFVLEKKADLNRTHMVDAVSYGECHEHPIAEDGIEVQTLR